MNGLDSDNSHFVIRISDVKQVEADVPVIQEDLLAIELLAAKGWFPSLSDAPRENLVLVFPRSKESAKMFFEIYERVKELVE